jgi:BolA protein
VKDFLFVTSVPKSQTGYMGNMDQIAKGETKMAGPLQTEMETLLTAAFAPTHLAVINDSASHSGHSGDDGSGESHFTIEIESAAFAGVNRVMRQRMVNRALGDIPGQRVHALAIKARAPGDKVLNT